MKEQNPDFVCIQELKAQESDISENIRNCPGYNFYAHYAAKKGYSGCAVYSKEKADRIRLGFGIEEFDNEGRYVELSFKNFILISVYFPSGSSSDER